jgi:DNA sulfur modification protein DndB
MFSDLNRTARTTSKSLNILYNHRDLMSQIALIAIERVSAFKGAVDKDRISLPIRSPKLFTLGAIYDATFALLSSVSESDFEQKRDLAVEYFETVAANIPEWGRVRSGEMKPVELRQEYIHTHAVILWALGGMGQTLISNYPDTWKEKLKGLRNIDWRRTNREWQGIAMSGTDVVNRRQSRKDAASFLKLKMSLALTPAEERSLKGATDVKSIMTNLKKLIA